MKADHSFLHFLCNSIEIIGLRRANIPWQCIEFLCYNRVMQVQLNKPDLEKFIGEQVKAGNFPSADAAVEAAIERMRLDSQLGDLDDETAAAINRAEEQLDRGQGIDFQRFAAEMRKKFPTGR
jgi:Arc/MetJ-type ribon-helix-helix transcriptional regulator